MRYQITSFLLLLLGIPFLTYAQHSELHPTDAGEPEAPPFRIAVLLGHTLIPAEHAGENFFIPSWGLDLEYWIQKKWGVGIHSDLEIETFIILRENSDQEELERISPLVVTLDALYKPWRGLVLQIGPGIEFEKNENYPLLRAGIEYEFELNHHWDIAPTVFYDTRFSEYHTWSIALGVGKRF
jgi:hypothetical protein